MHHALAIEGPAGLLTRVIVVHKGQGRYRTQALIYTWQKMNKTLESPFDRIGGSIRGIKLDFVRRRDVPTSFDDRRGAGMLFAPTKNIFEKKAYIPRS